MQLHSQMIYPSKMITFVTGINVQFIGIFTLID